MSILIPTIGLEIHAEIKTRSKMFCGCTNAPDQDEPNIYICPVCMAHPGSLPVINKEAVREVLRVGTAIGATLATFTEFDRKNYFYPDIPKGYQISQYKFPLVSGGRIGVVDVTRIHLEEDTARSTHGDTTSSVDFNRAGVPLMELVTEPVIHDAETAVAFARDFRLLLKYLGASDANLDKGEMRIEANISVAPEGAALGTKVEVKNLNSFKAVEQAIAYEIKRHTEMLARNDEIAQETRGWDENNQKTFSQRAKENSNDYRYFPDPDLPKLQIDEIEALNEDVLKETYKELPWDIRTRYVENGLQEQLAELLVSDIELNTFYATVVELLENKKQKSLAANYLTSDIVGLMSKQDYSGKRIEELKAKEFAELIQMIEEGMVSSRGGKDVLAIWMNEGGSAKKIAEENKLVQISDTSELTSIIKDILSEHEAVVVEYKAGKETAIQYLVGQGMKATKGAANPGVLAKMLKEEIAKN